MAAALPRDLARSGADAAGDVGGVLEKLGFPIAVFALYAQGRVAASVVAFASIDLVLAVLFTIAYLRTPSSSQTRALHAEAQPG